MNQAETNLKFVCPVVVTQNSAIITKSDGTVVLAFLQFNNLLEPTQADVVAAVELKDLSKLEELRESIKEHLEKEKNKEK